MPPLFSQIVISGVGLLGGSIARAAKKHQLAAEIIGVCRSESSCRRVLESGTVDRAVLTYDEAFRWSADQNKNPVLVIAAVPVNSIVTVLKKAVEAIAAFGKERSFLLTDVGSTKEKIVQAMAGLTMPEKAIFIGSHPIAGSDKTGVEASFDTLFEGRRTVITPEEDYLSGCSAVSSQYNDQFNLLQTFWRSLGSEIIIMPPATHDQILARTSHLPQLLASALSMMVNEEEHRFCGTGFAGMTRLAGSSPVMWNDIFQANCSSVLMALEAYTEILDLWKAALRRENPEERFALLTEGKRKRDAFINGPKPSGS